ncbi:ATP:cob(I)alamin adenosyltransferase [Sulfolobales archaeon HS-7]|nr:ATP:cob(I)alamin adenosyltransferase [Sulfolobales archaeon HS-7]
MWYTGKGDSGKTNVPSAGNVWKDDAIVDALGDLDELNAFLGLAASTNNAIKDDIEKVQSDIFTIASRIAGFNLELDESKVKELEGMIRKYGDELPQLRNFVLPGGDISASTLHIARTVCRRAERKIVSLYKESHIGSLEISYLNRLSSLLFVMALWCNKKKNIEERIWKK